MTHVSIGANYGVFDCDEVLLLHLKMVSSIPAGGSGTGAAGVLVRVLFVEDVETDAELGRPGAYTAQVSSCYETALSADPALAFDTKLTFKINTDGKVSEAKADGAGDGPGAPAVAKCVVEKSATWTFPAAGTVALVSQPYSFKKQAEKQ